MKFDNARRTTVVNVQATDADLPTPVLLYSISGGIDQERFAIDGLTGELTFLVTPDYEAPADSDGDNNYYVEVAADDQTGRTAVQSIQVTVTPVNDNAPAFTCADEVSVPENTTSAILHQLRQRRIGLRDGH